MTCSRTKSAATKPSAPAQHAPIQLPLGWGRAYLVPAEDGWALVDSGSPLGTKRLFRALERHGVRPNTLRLIVVTHVHYDHAANVAAVQAWSGAPVLVHALEADLLATGRVVVPGGFAWNSVIETSALALLNRLLRPQLPPHQAAITVQGGERLDDFGLAGTVLHTPGHTAGSISLLLDDGAAIVGDVAVNHYPFNLGPIFPTFGESRSDVYTSWRALLAARAQTIYPGHGTPFAAALLRQKLQAAGQAPTMLTPNT